jgi:hypothetical protein
LNAFGLDAALRLGRLATSTVLGDLQPCGFDNLFDGTELLQNFCLADDEFRINWC